MLASEPPQKIRAAQYILRLTPHGRLLVEEGEVGIAADAAATARLLDASSRGTGALLFELAAGFVGTPLPPTYSWWRTYATRYVTALCRHTPRSETGKAAAAANTAANETLLTPVRPPSEADLATLVLSAPMMTGADFITAELLRGMWAEIASAAAAALADSGLDLQSFLKSFSPVWNLVGRVYFNLAENRNDEEAPFAFLATYTSHVSANAKAQHMPLGQALREYTSSADKERLLSLLVPVNEAKESSPWLRPMIDSGDIYHPLRFTVAKASQFLLSTESLEQAGIIVRLPAAWRAKRPSRPRITAVVGSREPSRLGLDALLDFRLETAIDGEPLTEAETATLLQGTDGLVMLRGQWVEVDRARLAQTMDRFSAAQALANRDGLTFAEAMRMIAGTSLSSETDIATTDWSEVTAGAWLAEILQQLRAPQAQQLDTGGALRATLREYQTAGVHWLHLLSSLGLGACLADDMGLGKTIQVLTLLLLQQQSDAQKRITSEQAAQPPQAVPPNLLVVPASLLANWTLEIEKFAPSIRTRTIHASAMPAAELKTFAESDIRDTDLVITSYATLQRVQVLRDMQFRLVILDEAQAIKNPGAKQTRTVKALKSASRIALTGTPVENSLGDLWSIFDFINPGLLGDAKQFTRYTKGLHRDTEHAYAPLRELVRPYILRRMKTDRAIIADLPDKTEVKAFCTLRPRQAALYEQAVEEIAMRIRESEGNQRRALMLTMLMRLKQICNHPAQWLDNGEWDEQESGKFSRLREIAEMVAARQEKMLVFTQFREVTRPLHDYLHGIFGRPGLVLDGTTKIAERRDLVSRFQDDEDVPYFVLSLKAGGAGLTLTAASHVVHFDRWWNPAVENQATDRAFRIGQKRNVLVQKFICRGTVEEKIDEMISSKQSLTDSLLGEGSEINLTELSDDAFLALIRLNLQAVSKD